MQIKAKDTKYTTRKRLKEWLFDKLLLQREGYELWPVQKQEVCFPGGN